MKILGIHDGHNATACLLEDGKIRYVIQEESLTRIKEPFTISILGCPKDPKIDPIEL